MKTTEILIVTYQRDFRYLVYALRSIKKYVTGFSGVTVAFPEPDLSAFDELLKDSRIDRSSIKLAPFDQWEGKGFLHHMYLKVCADLIVPKADRILHMDSDCFFTRPVTPASYTNEHDMPIVVHAPFDWLIRQQGNLVLWQQAVERALGWKPVHEFMRRHPLMFNRDVYHTTRTKIHQHTQMSLESFMKAQRNEFPQTFAEFPTLGEIAWTCHHADYVWRDQSKGEWPQDNPMETCWSHREPTAEDRQRLEKALLL